MPERTLAVIGAGLVGLATAKALSRRQPHAQIVVIEKEGTVAAHQSSHNSGVLHCGLYYKPGSARAQLAVKGIRTMTAFCREHSILHEICGKVVVATDDTELARLKTLHERGIANGLAGLRWLSPTELREREPNVLAVGALLVPEEGIVDYPGVALALVGGLRRDGVDLRFQSPVSAIIRDRSGWVIRAGSAELRCDAFVNCAGLHSDRVARMAGVATPTRIVPFRGDYWQLRASREALVRHLVYPVPDPTFPFLGVHFTRMIGGGVECGPNAVLAFHREGYRRTAFSVRDAAEAVGFSGLRRFVAKHPGAVSRELWRGLSRRAFTRSLQRLVPDITGADLEPGQVGVRAQALRPDGSLVDDFDFVDGPNSVHVLNAPSPAATASLVIGEAVAGRLLQLA